MTETADVLVVAERALQDRWPGCRLSDPRQFSGQGSSRNLVLRARVTGGGADTVVVKHQVAGRDSERSVREPAALSVLPPGSGFLELLAVGEDTLVLGDLGDGGSLADRLLGSDPELAAEGVCAWATAIGRLHRASAALAPAFDAALAEQAARVGRATPQADPTPLMLADAGVALAEQLPALGVRPQQAALDELRGLDDLLGGGPDARRLTPSDACPDNNSFTAEGLVLLDFESAQWRHVAWDAAYVLVPWPSCWCSWAMPSGASEAALAAWQRASGVEYAGFADDLRALRTGWAFCSMAWFLEGALMGDHSHDREMPTRRAMIWHRLSEAVRDPDPRLPGLNELAQQVLAAAEGAWGPQPLALAPAFRPR